MKTAEELYDKHSRKVEYSNGGHIGIDVVFNPVDFKKALAEHDKELELIIPVTFFAGLSFEERLKMLVRHWQRAIIVNQSLEKELTKLKDRLSELEK